MDELIGITFGQEYWCAMGGDLPTVLGAQTAYAAQDDPLWINLMSLKRMQQNILLNKGDVDGDAESTFSMDDEGDEKAVSQIRQETGDWSTAYTF
jgi:hypothetical protein